ncbi:MAG TPA: outer membrane beta-barrel family protein [Sphingobacteriaceae bacterium]
MRYFFLLLSLMVLNICVSAQTQNHFLVKGSAADSTSDKPISFATVSILDGNQTVATGFTKDDGTFELRAAQKEYTLAIASVGYLPKKLTISWGTTRTNVADMGKVMLAPVSKTLKEVVVVGARPLIEQADDRIAYNVEDDPSAKTSTAIDILRKTPFVTVDGEDNIQVNGQGNFKVLLNGKETALFSTNVKEALKGFQASLIVKVEVITNPSSKYDAEGVGGIINIITKKKISGYNGSLSPYYSTLDNYSGSGNINLKTNKIGLTAFTSANGSRPLRSTELSETFSTGNALYSNRSMLGDRLKESHYTSASLEISYELDSLNTFSGYGTLSRSESLSSIDQDITTLFSNSVNELSSLKQETERISPSFNIGMDYIRKFKQKDKEFSVRLNSQSGNTTTSGNSLFTTANNLRDQASRNTAENFEHTLQSDYILPLAGKMKLETGVKMIIRRAKSDYQSLIRYSQTGSYAADPFNSDNFNYNQDVYSAYGSFNFNVAKFGFRTGLRAESTIINGNFIASNEKVRQKYTNLIPNLQATRRWSPVYTSVVAYSIRLNRPYISNLNPFINNSDSLNVSFGNPDLGPQTVHSLSLQNRFIFGNTFASITLTGFRSNNIIVQYATFDRTTGITKTTSDNIGRENQLTLSGNFNGRINPDWSVWTGGLLRYNHTENTAALTPDAESLSGGFYIGSNYKLSKWFNLSGSGGFTQAPTTLLSKGSLFGYYQVNFGYVLLQDKLTGTVNFNNMHQETMGVKTTVQNSNFRTVNLSTSPYRVIYFGLTYRFGKLKESVSLKRGVKNDDLIEQ